MSSIPRSVTRRSDSQTSVFTFKITLGQHHVNHFRVQMGEHLLHAFDHVLLGGAGKRRAGGKVIRHGTVICLWYPVTCVVPEASLLWQPNGDSGWALSVLLPPGHSVVALQPLCDLISGYTELTK